MFKFFLCAFFVSAATLAASSAELNEDSILLLHSINDLPFYNLSDEAQLEEFKAYLLRSPSHKFQHNYETILGHTAANNLAHFFIALLRQPGVTIPRGPVPHLPVDFAGHIFRNCTLPQLALLYGRLDFIRFLLGYQLKFDAKALDESNKEWTLIDMAKEIKELPKDLLALITKRELQSVLEQFNQPHENFGGHVETPAILLPPPAELTSTSNSFEPIYQGFPLHQQQEILEQCLSIQRLRNKSE